MPDAAVSCQFMPTVVPYGSSTATLADVLLVLPKIAYLTLCRFIQLLELLAGGDTAKDLELSSYATGSPSSADRLPRPRLELSGRALLAERSIGCCPEPAGRVSVVTPAMYLRWHRHLIGGAWTGPAIPTRE
jgi:hypothetical protein